MRVAIVIGHKEHVAEGARNPKYGLTEVDFNEPLAVAIHMQLLKRDLEARIFRRKTFYHLVDAINKYEPVLTVSLHANAGPPSASGTEVLYWHASEKGRIVAETLSHQLAKTLELPLRGAKPVKEGERGWYLLKKTRMPAVICEPFFITNTEDLEKALMKFSYLIRAYVDNIEYLVKYVI